MPRLSRVQSTNLKTELFLDEQEEQRILAINFPKAARSPTLFEPEEYMATAQLRHLIDVEISVPDSVD